jgi:hypothetical protein
MMAIEAPFPPEAGAVLAAFTALAMPPGSAKALAP